MISNIKILKSEVKMPLLVLPVNTVLVETKKGKILISPGSKLTKDQLKSFTSVTDIVASNLYHHAGIPQALDVFPKAVSWAVPGLKEKVNTVNWSHVFNQDAWPYSDEVEVIFLEGLSKLNEVIFIHKPSKTLIATDMCFNILNPKGFGPWLIYKMFGTYNRFAVSKFFLKYITNKEEFHKSIQKVFSYDFENIIPSHGEIIMGGGKDKLRAAFAERGLKLVY